jgi:hypothetical protein
VTKAASAIKIPVFITSAKSEHKSWKTIFEAIPSTHKQSFLPKTKGNHGSRALWEVQKDSDAYWSALQSFLTDL